MADLPEGALLIPNPINNIPGFFVDQHYFMPGFPEMAWPMIDWVIENNLLKTEKTTKFEDHSIWLDDVSESSLIDLMNQTQLKFNNIKIYSLPKMHPKKMLELGVKGEHGYVFEALNFIKDNLNSMNISWRDL
jgi:molybdopterin-biosynthesis enzyme MoeA-like protein